MQQRFCSCGFPVWVQYLFSETNCNALFWATVYRTGKRITRCPLCGSTLDIDQLR